MRLVIAVALVALGCGKREKPTTCADAARATVEVIVRGAKRDGNQLLDARATGLRAALTRLCVDDNWSADAIACFAKSSTAQDVPACRGKLAPDAQTHLDEELETAATPIATPTPVVTPVAPTGDTAGPAEPPMPDDKRQLQDQLRALETRLGEAKKLAGEAETGAEREAAQAVIKELDTQMELLERQLGPHREQELDRQLDELNRKIDEVRDQLGETRSEEL